MNRTEKFYKKNLIVTIFSLILLFCIPTVHSAEFKGKVLGLQVNGNAVYFSVSGASYAECGKNHRFIFNAGTPYGKKLYLQIKDVFSADKEIMVSSLGTCTLAPDDAEDIINLMVPDDREVK